MIIHFVLPGMGKTGGVIVVLEHARRLRDRGHEVRVYHPILPAGEYYRGRPRWKRIAVYARDLLRNLLNARRDVSWFADAPTLRAIPWISGRFMRDADAVIATAWPTAHRVNALPPAKGTKYYFIQHYEDWHGQIERLDATFRLPLRLLTIAPWLTELVRVRFGRQVHAEIHNGIDLNVFSPPDKKPDGPPVILMMYHHLEIKGTPYGLEALRRIHDRHPHVRIRLFGLAAWTPDHFMEYFPDPSRDTLLRLYRDAHIFMSPSLSEGWHLPPMEAMACGCAVVATRVGCIPVLEREGNMLAAEPGDAEALFAHLDALVRDPGLRARTAQLGLETIREYSWEKMAPAFERALSQES